jgi:flagellar FliL protein
MTTEPRIVSPNQKIGARPTGTDAGAKDEEKPKGGKKKKLIMIGAAVGVVVLVAAYWFLMGPGKAAAAPINPALATASPQPTYQLGAVLAIDSISINLQGGHYLRLGLGLQLIKSVKTPPDKAEALDAAIALFSGHTTEELADPTVRADLKKQLEVTLMDLYKGDVVAVYYTDFVTQ